VRIERALQKIVGLRPWCRGQADHPFAGGMQPEPAHRSVHAVHVDDHVVGIAFPHHFPAAGAFVDFAESRFQSDLSGLIHPCQA